jgi:hypothetical protein
MKRVGWRTATLPAAVLLVALALHHGAYRGYFEDDDLATLTWTGLVPLSDLVLDVPSVRYPPAHARPTGYFYFAALDRRFHLDYPPYVAALHMLAAVNVVLLWLLLRRIGLEPVACAVGCAFFAWHRALFDGWWKPMFVYDVLCATFALASILAYVHRRWVLSFLAFWLAMRSKEVGIAVPAMLLWYEMTLGERKWLRVLPFLAPAAIYGGFGLVYNLHQQSSYSFHFEGAALAKSVAFYLSKLLWIKYAGFGFLLLPFVVRDRRVWFGVGTMLLGLAVYLLLPGRLIEIYLYLAMTGAAVAVAALAARRPAIALGLVAMWAGWQYLLISKNARITLAAADERRAYVSALRSVPDSRVYIYDAIPASMHSWGVDGALRLFHPGIETVHRLEDAGLPTSGEIQLLNWDGRRWRLTAEPFSTAAAASIAADPSTPAWQLVSGWGPAAAGYRQIEGRALARLYRPERAGELSWEACGAGPVKLRTFVAGEEIANVRFSGDQCMEERARLKAAPAGIVTLEFQPSEAGVPVRIGRIGIR